MERFGTFARLTGDDRYRRICEQHLQRFEELHIEVTQRRKAISKVLSTAENPDNPPEEYYQLRDQLNPIEEEQDRCAITAVVFAAMCLEAFIYDYAALCLSDTYVQKYLDKLDLVSKWIVFPRLVSGKEIPRDSHAFERLRKLSRARNDLVHLKSREVTEVQKLGDYMEEREQWII
jgi:hypothetical protein